jgi:hypothetical protein
MYSVLVVDGTGSRTFRIPTYCHAKHVGLISAHAAQRLLESKYSVPSKPHHAVGARKGDH